MINASVGQTSAHSPQLMQSSGRGSQGKEPDISRQDAGQITTQSPHPLQRLASKAGNSRIRMAIDRER